MNDALHGREAWRGPGKRDRGRRRVTGSRVIKTRVFGLSRCLARGNEPDVQCLRFDDHARDMALDQLAVRKRGLGFCCVHCCKVPADAVAHEGLDLGGRHAGDAACLGLAILQDRMRHIIPVAHAALVRMRRAHAVAAVVEEAAGQNGGRAPEPDPSRDGVGGALGLHGLEHVAAEDRLMLAAMHLTPIGDFADVEPVVEQMGKGTHAEADTAAPAAIATARSGPHGFRSM